MEPVVPVPTVLNTVTHFNVWKGLWSEPVVKRGVMVTLVDHFNNVNNNLDNIGNGSVTHLWQYLFKA